MKITEYGSIRNTAAARKKASSGGVAGNFADFLGLGSDSGTPATSNVSSAMPMEGLLGLQEVSDAEVSRKRIIRQGNSLLDSLEQLRDSLLIGRLPMDVLKTLENRLANQRELTADPALHSLMDDIELRAAVELAKLERAMELKNAPPGTYV